MTSTPQGGPVSREPVRFWEAPEDLVLRKVLTPAPSLFHDNSGNGFFITSVELWSSETILSLRWKPPVSHHNPEPALILTDEHGHGLSYKGSWGAGARVLQHYDAIPEVSKVLSVLIRRPSSPGPSELFSLRTRLADLRRPPGTLTSLPEIEADQ